MAYWKYTVKGWGTMFAGDGDPFTKRDQLVALRPSQWYADEEGGDAPNWRGGSRNSSAAPTRNELDSVS